ncbi:MAG: S41 family peptidase [Bacteroidales bacterium]|nr:S41 family peptidase [Bacteroidales bacterium]MCD8394094.1 S41 family peptidase [Bacteroidales bacterium]
MRKLLFFALALIVAGAAVGAATRSDKAAVSRSLDVFNSLFKQLQTSYVDTIDAEKCINTAIDAMLSELDPYTEYYPEKDQESFRTISTGEYGGIGSYIMYRNGNTYVSEPQTGSPALAAGLRPGDLFITIDGDTVLGWDTEKVSQRLRGQAGTKVNVRVKRPYVEDSILDFEITRAKIQVHPVPYYGVLRDTLGYIALTTFNEKSATEVRDALLELKKDPHVKAIVLDLRNNGGGILEGAVKIAGLFVPKGTEIVRTRGKGLVNEKIYKTTANPVDTEIPLVILINNGSASAAEIVSGALQDLDRAVLVGSTSFGKGLVQGSRMLPYNGILKVTQAKYYIPSGRLIQAIDYSRRNPDGSVARIPDSLTHEFTTAHGRIVRDGGGITPDIKVEFPDATRLTYNIVRDNWAFDFANRYYAQHDTIPAPETFEITDTIFNEFKAFIDPDKFHYDRVCETMLADLEKTAKVEGYLNDSTRAEFDVLRKLLKHDLDKDLNTNRPEISDFLASEIVQRYYNQRGQIIQSLRNDIVIDSVMKIVSTPGRYAKELAPNK